MGQKLNPKKSRKYFLTFSLLTHIGCEPPATVGSPCKNVIYFCFVYLIVLKFYLYFLSFEASSNTLDYIISLLIVWYISTRHTFERFHYIKTFKEDFYSFRYLKGSLSDQRFDWVRAWQYLYNMPRPSENGLLWIFICAQLYVKVIMGLWQASVPSSTAIRTINFPIVSGDRFRLKKTLCMK